MYTYDDKCEEQWDNQLQRMRNKEEIMDIYLHNVVIQLWTTWDIMGNWILIQLGDDICV